jgi:hypothetical protein
MDDGAGDLSVGDRRDHVRRAEVFRRVVAWLQQRSSAEPIWGDVDAGARRRILARLAVRGLARYSQGGWIAGPVLGRAAELRPDPVAA